MIKELIYDIASLALLDPKWNILDSENISATRYHQLNNKYCFNRANIAEAQQCASLKCSQKGITIRQKKGKVNGLLTNFTPLAEKEITGRIVY